jgi:DNA primase
MKILEESIELVRNSVNIVDVVGQYVPLRKKGKNFWGVCPFHTEKTPSFSVHAEKQIFHCFGCHAGGNVFKFLMDYKKISYPEAIEELAHDIGIQLKYDESFKVEKQSENELLLDFNQEVARLFFDTLQDSPEAQQARDYFNSRKLKKAIMRSFGLGYAPSSRTFLTEKYADNKQKLDMAFQLGLTGQNDNGNYYDRFSGRIIFPIFSPNGRVIGFGGRIMEKRENTGKYLNSPESPIYHKGRVLYGLSHAKDEIRKLDWALLVEGYMDLLSLHQNGIKNVIAVSGTALTDEQVSLLSRYTKNVRLLFDADEAGIKASMRSVEILLKRQMNIKIASLPSGEDPDSYINSHSTKEFMEQLDKAVDFLEFQFGFYKKTGKLDDPVTGTEIIRELLKPVALIDDELQRAMYLNSLSEKFNLRGKLLEDELKEILNRNMRMEKQAAIQSAPVLETGKRKAAAPKEEKKFQNPMEKELIKLLFENEKAIIALINKYIMDEEFTYEPHRKFVEIVFARFQEDEDISVSSILDSIQDEYLTEYLTSLVFEPYAISDEWEKLYPTPSRRESLIRAAIDTIVKFKSIQIDQDFKRINAGMKDEQDIEKQVEYLNQIKDLQDSKKTIKEMIEKNFAKLLEE